MIGLIADRANAPRATPTVRAMGQLWQRAWDFWLPQHDLEFFVAIAHGPRKDDPQTFHAMTIHELRRQLATVHGVEWVLFVDRTIGLHDVMQALPRAANVEVA